jgi:hypothetical protein
MEAEDPAPALAVRAGPVAAARRAVVSGIAPSVTAHPAHPVARLTTGHPSERVDDEVPGVAVARRAGRPRPSDQDGPSSGIRVLPVRCARAPVARRTPWRAVGGEAKPALYGRPRVQEVVADDAPRPAAGDRPATDDHCHGRAVRPHLAATLARLSGVGRNGDGHHGGEYERGNNRSDEQAHVARVDPNRNLCARFEEKPETHHRSPGGESHGRSSLRGPAAALP